MREHRFCHLYDATCPTVPVNVAVSKCDKNTTLMMPLAQLSAYYSALDFSAQSCGTKHRGRPLSVETRTVAAALSLGASDR